MQTNLQILISGTSTSGELTLFGNEPIDITYNIADVKDISKSKSSFSKSFSLPGDKNNNRIFSHIFEITNEALDFNPNIKANVQILADSIPVMNGYLQLTNISLDNQKNPVYNVVCTAEKNTLFSNMGESFITDLDFSELNHEFDAAHQAATWVTGYTPYYYPLIDYNYNWTENDIAPTGATISSNAPGPTKLFPATQVKYIVDKIFSAAGFTYSSAFFNSPRFKNMYIPYNGSKYGAKQSADWATQRGFSARVNDLLPRTSRTFYSNVMSAQTSCTGFTHKSYPLAPVDGNIDYSSTTNSNFNLGTQVFTAFDNCYGTFNVQLVYRVEFSTTALTFDYSSSCGIPGRGFSIDSHFYRSSYLSGNTPFFIGSHTGPYMNQQILYAGSANISSTSTPPLSNYDSATLYPIISGETFWVKHVVAIGVRPTVSTTGVTTGQTIFRVYNNYNPDILNAFNCVVQPVNVLGNTIDYNKMLPQKIKQTDFFKGLINMFNLYIEPSKTNTNQLIIEPRDAYYSAGTQLNWSNKLDLSVPIEESFLTDSQARKITFTYKEDKDYLNTYYKDSTDRIYGNYIWGVNSDFSADEKKIETIFSPTVAAKIEGINFYMPKLYKFDNNNYGDIATNIRILNKAIVTGVTWNYAGTNYDYYPYIGHTDIPGDNSTFDINFGTVEWETFDVALGDNNLVNEYWLNYLEEISDPTSKIINCNLYLTPSDISNFKFNNTVFIQGIDSTAGAYYYVNKISYNPTVNQTSKVELLKARPLRVRLTTSAILNALRLNRLNRLNNSILSLGNNYNLANNSILVGNNSYQLSNVSNSMLIGNQSTMLTSSINTMAIGDFNQVAGYNSMIMGDNIQIIPTLPAEEITGSTGTTSGPKLKSLANNTVMGSDNVTISGASGNSINNSSNVTSLANNALVQSSSNVYIPLEALNVSLLGVSDYTATTADSNSVVVPNLNFSTSAGTINGTPIGAITSGSTILSAGTGTGSVIVNNGTGNIASGNYSFAEGAGTLAFNLSTHSEGWGTTAFGSYSHAEGFETTTLITSQGGHAEGFQTTASGVTAHAEGSGTTAIGNYSHSEGWGSIAGGEASHAEGIGTISSGNYSHTEGAGTVASGQSSHAEGENTTAGGFASHAEGESTTAIGDNSYAGGYKTETTMYGEWARSSINTNIGAQYGIVDYFAITTNATTTEIFIANIPNTRFLIPAGDTYKIKLRAVLAIQSTGESKEFEGQGLIKNVGGATSLVGSFTMTSTNGDAALAATTMTITADNTNDTLKVEVTGIAATNINWYVKAEYERTWF